MVSEAVFGSAENKSSDWEGSLSSEVALSTRLSNQGQLLSFLSDTVIPQEERAWNHRFSKKSSESDNRRHTFFP